MRNASDKIVDKNKTHFVFNNFYSENIVVCEIRENMGEVDRPQMTI
jgi:hypothetical protein